MLRTTNFQREIAKRAITRSGEFVALVHISGSPTWAGDYDEIPVYTSSTSTVAIRATPVLEEIRFGDQIFGVGDLKGFFSYDCPVDIHDTVTFSGTSLYSGTWIVAAIEKHETSFGTFMRFQREL